MNDSPNISEGFNCPVPLPDTERVQLGHGSGGKQTAALVQNVFLKHLSNGILDRQTDAAFFDLTSERIAVSTDTFVVKPLEFPGGDIGSLAVHGTLNDLAMMGARPLCLTAGFVLEEGLSLKLLDRLVASMAGAAERALDPEGLVEAGSAGGIAEKKHPEAPGPRGVPIICGDTKVVERGKADGIYINTTGIGRVDPEFSPTPEKAQSGDAVILSGPIGRHGIAVMAKREGLELDVEIESDAATLWPLVQRLRNAVGDSVHVLRDPTRGGVATAINEIAQTAGIGVVLNEGSIQVPEPVAATCELLGFDPLYVANEGVLIAIVAAEAADDAVESLRAHPLGLRATIVGHVVKDNAGIVAVETTSGGTRVADMLSGDLLPRIC